MRISAVNTYPVKGCHRLDHDVAVVEPWGLAGDRRWMMIDADGVGITQRDTPRLTQLSVRTRPGGLVLSAPELPDLEVDEPVGGPPAAVRVFKSKQPVPALVADAEWSSAFLGREARLVWQADPTGRTIESHARADDHVSLADGFPLLLANTASLDSLNDWLIASGQEPIPMTRFRPNLSVSGAEPWAEDTWIGRRLRIGEMTFRAAKPCGRCVVTTIDQESGEKGREPLRMLGKHRRFGNELHFAINLIPDIPAGGAGKVSVTDEVSVVLGDS